jgi:putative hemolysin
LRSRPTGGLVLGLARTDDEIEAVQRLRYRAFTEEFEVSLPSAAHGIDADRFDPWCEHFMVQEESSGRVVGTYRLLTPANARKAGGYYAETEFALHGMADIQKELVELGRSCTHPDYRDGSVIMLLWSGIAKLVQQSGFRYVLGCASVSLRDDGIAAAQVWRLANQGGRRAAASPRLEPRHPYPVERVGAALPTRLPPLLKGYLKLGAEICGNPAWDPDFNAADFPVLLDMNAVDARYRRHFGIADLQCRRPKRV